MGEAVSWLVGEEVSWLVADGRMLVRTLRRREAVARGFEAVTGEMGVGASLAAVVQQVMGGAIASGVVRPPPICPYSCYRCGRGWYGETLQDAMGALSINDGSRPTLLYKPTVVIYTAIA